MPVDACGFTDAAYPGRAHNSAQKPPTALALALRRGYAKIMFRSAVTTEPVGTRAQVQFADYTGVNAQPLIGAAHPARFESSPTTSVCGVRNL